MSFAENITRIGDKVNNEESKEATEKFVKIIKDEGGWDITGNPLHPHRPFKMVDFETVLEKAGGYFVENQYGEKIAVSFGNSKREIIVKESHFDIGHRKGREMRDSGQLPYLAYGNWKSFIKFCPFGVGTQEARGWWVAVDGGQGKVDSNVLITGKW